MRQTKMVRRGSAIVEWAFFGFLVAVVVAGIWFVRTERDKPARDEKRRVDLQEIRIALDRHYRTYQSYPLSLSLVTDKQYLYKYNQNTNLYLLCATMETQESVTPYWKVTPQNPAGESAKDCNWQ